MAILAPSEGYSLAISSAFKNEFKRLGGKITLEVSYSSKAYDLSASLSKIESKIKDIEGLYVPLTDKRDAPVILSQLERLKINLILYGNQDWLSAKGFESSSRLSNQLTFSSDYFIDYDDSGYQEFNKAFHLKNGIDANRNVLYGYDAAGYVLNAFPDIKFTRDELKKKMESGFVFKGFHNNIVLDTTRVNKSINIIRYKEGKFQLIDKFRIGE
jgi:branched-chain amino acid transport system substrate-binding protein